MLGEEKIKVCVITPLRVIKKMIEDLHDEKIYELSFIEPESINAANIICDIIMVDQVFASDPTFISSELVQNNHGALFLCMVDSDDLSAHPTQRVDWTISYNNLMKDLNTAVHVLSVIKQKAARGVYFDELLSLSRVVKHNAANALSVAQAAAHKFIEIHEKYRAAGLFISKGVEPVS